MDDGSGRLRQQARSCASTSYCWPGTESMVVRVSGDSHDEPPLPFAEKNAILVSGCWRCCCRRRRFHLLQLAPAAAATQPISRTSDPSAKHEPFDSSVVALLPLLSPEATWSREIYKKYTFLVVQISSDRFTPDEVKCDDFDAAQKRAAEVLVSISWRTLEPDNCWSSLHRSCVAACPGATRRVSAKCGRPLSLLKAIMMFVAKSFHHTVSSRFRLASVVLLRHPGASL